MNDYIPSLAILTGGIELVAAVYFTLLFKDKKPGVKGMILLLFFLSGYQLLEALNCMGLGNKLLVRLAFADITWLPAIGVYTAYKLNPVKSKVTQNVSRVFMLSAAFFTAWFVLNPSTAVLKSCQSFYATYGNSFPIYTYYGVYYQLGMLLMVIIGIRAMIQIKDARDRSVVADFIIGSILFIIPSLGVTAVFKHLQGSMPSVMCHIAIFFTIFLIKGLIKEKTYQGLSLKDLNWDFKNIWS